MVEGSAAGRISDDTPSVLSENERGSGDRNRGDTVGDGRHQSILAVRFDRVDSFDLDWATIVSEARAVRLGVIGVVSLKRNTTVVENVPHAVVLPATVAAEGFWVAVDALLLGELKQFARLDEVLTLHGGNSGKGPARAALALILDWVHAAKLNPVDFCWKIVGWSGISNKVAAVASNLRPVAEEILPLLLSPVRELVMAHR